MRKFNFNNTTIFEIDQFPKEFKKNWLTSIDLRYICILIICFTVILPAFKKLASYYCQNNNPIHNSNLQENYVRIILDETLKKSGDDDLVENNDIPTDTHLYGIDNNVSLNEQYTPNLNQKIVSNISNQGSTIQENSKIDNNFINQKIVENNKVTSNIKIRSDKPSLAKIFNSNNIIADNRKNNKKSNKKLLASIISLPQNNINLASFLKSKRSFQNLLNSISNKNNINSPKKIKQNKTIEIISNKNDIPGFTNGKIRERTPEQVSTAILAHNKTIQSCYKQALKHNSNIKGKITIQFSVTPSGNISEANIINSTMNDTEIENCIIQKIKEWNDFGICDTALGDLNCKQTYTFGDI